MLLVKVSVPLKPPHWLWNYVLSTIYNTQIHKYTLLLKLFKINTIPQNIYFSSVSLNEKSSRQFYFYILNVPACHIPDSSQWSTKATPRSLKSGTKIITKLWPVLTLMWFLPPVQHWLAGGGGRRDGWGGGESHGKQSGCCHMVHVCRLSWLEEEEFLVKSLCKRKLEVFFHVAPSTSWRAARTKQPAMEIPAINLKVSSVFA